MAAPSLQQMLDDAIHARRAGRTDVAMALFQRVLASGGDHPVALNALGMHALALRRAEDAAVLFQRAIAADPIAPDLWMNLAKARREAGDDAGEEAALNGALAIDQRHFMALVRMAELLERRGDEAGAAGRWSNVLAMAPAIEDRSPALESMFDHAQRYVIGQRDRFAAAVDRGLADARAAVGPADRRRVDACIDHALGRRAIYANACAGMHFPFLPAEEFFAREQFPWFAEIEAKTALIRTELESILTEDAGALHPYVAMPPGTPQNKWSRLDHSLEWGAMHLWKDGRRDEAACARAPLTAAAVEALPLSDLPGRTPTIFFSILQPGAHLPAHTGVSNVRTIIHLPLIVPPGCSFRVGGETRDWRVGEAWAFDDTIEHEAWNRSGQIRAILIFDVWNPYITPTERDLLRRFYAVAADSEGAPATALSISE